MSVVLGFPPNTLEKLKCTKCKGYLSVAPVSSTDSGYACGRCIADAKSVTIYEEVCQVHVFPCIYDEFGCKEVHKFGKEIRDHEDICMHRPVCCPKLRCCRWVGQISAIIAHFNESHTESLISKPKMEINLMANVEEWMVFYNKGRAHLLFVNYIKEQGLFIDVITPDIAAATKEECGIQIRSLRSGNKLCLSRFVHSYVHKYDSSDMIDFRALACVDNEIVFMEITFNKYH